MYLLPLLLRLEVLFPCLFNIVGWWALVELDLGEIDLHTERPWDSTLGALIVDYITT